MCNEETPTHPPLTVKELKEAYGLRSQGCSGWVQGSQHIHCVSSMVIVTNSQCECLQSGVLRLLPQSPLKPVILSLWIWVCNFFFKYVFIDFTEKERERERETLLRESLHWLFPAHPLLGIELATLAWVLTRNQTNDLSVNGTMLNQLRHTGQGWICNFWCKITLG